jgi:hypothetical protein
LSADVEGCGGVEGLGSGYCLVGKIVTFVGNFGTSKAHCPKTSTLSARFMQD